MAVPGPFLNSVNNLSFSARSRQNSESDKTYPFSWHQPRQICVEANLNKDRFLTFIDWFHHAVPSPDWLFFLLGFGDAISTHDSFSQLEELRDRHYYRVFLSL